MFPRIQSVTDVAQWQMCTGCGVCAYLEPQAIEMVDEDSLGRRPRLRGEPVNQGDLGYCPGVNLQLSSIHFPPGVAGELLGEWGPVLEVWEGYASDESIRLRASSGGGVTALALFGMEQSGMHGVLHTVPARGNPLHNESQLSVDRNSLLQGMGSRYGPASPCEALEKIESAPGPCMFIGKPCDVAATQAAARRRPGLANNLALTVNVFCAGTPSHEGARVLLKEMGVPEGKALSSFAYRGAGWPGMAEARLTPETVYSRMSYAQSWGIVQRYRQWRCYICVDHTGVFADISVGDPWDRAIEEGDPGRSLFVVRTEAGRQHLRAAIAAGYIHANSVPLDRLANSQPNLALTQASVWGRLMASRLLFLPVPDFQGFPLFKNWLTCLTGAQRFQSILGAFSRILRRKLYRRWPLSAASPTSLPPSKP